MNEVVRYDREQAKFRQLMNALQLHVLSNRTDGAPNTSVVGDILTHVVGKITPLSPLYSLLFVRGLISRTAPLSHTLT